MVTIYSDTREQRPFKFPKRFQGETIKIVHKELRTGDYIPHGHGEPRGGVVVERKSYGDFLSCVTKSGRLKHFTRQLRALQKWSKAVVVVEGSLTLCRVGIYSERDWTPLTLTSRVAELQATFNVPIVFADKRELAQAFALEWMFHAMDNIRNGDSKWEKVQRGKRRY